MATEHPEVETPTAPVVAETTQQATTPTPTQSEKTPKRVTFSPDTKQQATNPTPITRVKNPKRVAAGKRVAERTRIAREQQKKAAAEASVIIANNNAKATAAAPEPAPTTEVVESPSGLSINQWIGIGGLVVSAAGIYYKREELKAAFKKIRPEPAPASIEPEPAHAPQGKGLTKMA